MEGNEKLTTYNSMTLIMTSDEENWMNTSVHAIPMVPAEHIMNENSAAQIAKDGIACYMHIQSIRQWIREAFKVNMKQFSQPFYFHNHMFQRRSREQKNVERDLILCIGI